MTMKFPFIEDTLRNKLEAGTGISVDCLTCKRTARLDVAALVRRAKVSRLSTTSNPTGLPAYPSQTSWVKLRSRNPSRAVQCRIKRRINVASILDVSPGFCCSSRTMNRLSSSRYMTLAVGQLARRGGDQLGRARKCSVRRRRLHKSQGPHHSSRLMRLAQNSQRFRDDNVHQNKDVKRIAGTRSTTC
ncbi:hypothetical protein RFN28_10585 [Mesorhizobium sp. VK24D]|uniref:Uncharacterized protein n=1 Tax=Mesorhizobium album TaxID=3072314 RepID=A0ABU4XWF2_9HYPH|nr:hypothetical protein [Mesorhizobium sp. VK24D]MDX8478923.1 hypothetical protein [Mesorhizobium sp. VK24D]